MTSLHNRKQAIQQFVLLTGILIVLNILVSDVLVRIDLTSEKRFTLKEVTKETLENLEDIVYIEVYLDGEMPISFKRLQIAIRQQLDEYRVYAGKNLHYQFINPVTMAEGKERETLYRELAQQGIIPLNVKDRDEEGGASEKLLFPGALIRYKGRELAINLLSDNRLYESEQNINQSIETLEYQFMVAIKNLTIEEIRKVVFLEGHDEADQYQVGDISKTLSNFYQIDRGTIDKPDCLFEYDAVFIVKPRRAFKEAEKFAIDQYIMQGGKVLWFIDAVAVNIDSLARGSSLAFIQSLNIDDLLFRYGTRINPVLLKDQSCNVIPVNTGMRGRQARFSPLPWAYYPLLIPPSDHPVSKGLDLILGQFVNTLDTLATQGVRKEILLSSSARSKTVQAPRPIMLEEVQESFDATYNQGNQPVAIVMEGIFQSAFQNRMVKQYLGNNQYQYLSQSEPTNMLVVADGDMICNQVRNTRNGPVIAPLGYDRYTRQTFGNKDFIMNAFHYLMDDTGLMDLRSKNLKIRLLNKEKVRNERLKWQIINLALPSLIILMTGIFIQIIRKKRYAKR